MEDGSVYAYDANGRLAKQGVLVPQQGYEPDTLPATNTFSCANGRVGSVRCESIQYEYDDEGEPYQATK